MKLFTVLLIFISVTAFAETQKALIYPLGKTEGKPLFVQTTEVTTLESGERQWTSKIEDADGKVVMTEKAQMKDTKVLSQYIEQLQINEAYELKVEDKNALFLTYKIKEGQKGAPVDTNKIKMEDDFITGPLTQTYLQKNWDSLMGGNTVWANFGVFEVSKSIGFQFRKVASTDETLELKMKPSNFFISMLVDPIYIQLNSKNKRIEKFKGRTPLKIMKNGKWKSFDAEILYQYQ